MGYSKVERARIDAGVCVSCGLANAEPERVRCGECARRMWKYLRTYLRRRERFPRKRARLANGQLSYITVKRAQAK